MKELFSVLLTYALTTFGKVSSQNPVELIRKSVREEISAVSFKMLMGLILTCLVMVAIFYLGSALHSFLEQYENKNVLQMACFGLIAAAGSAGLYALFNADSSKSSTKVKPPTSNGEVDFHKLAAEFLEGFLQGMNSKKKP